MNKDLNISILMDFYSQLLTDKQQQALDMYYNSDLSLSEIAEETNISRQGVRDSIKRGEKQLVEFEEKLRLVARFSDIMQNIKVLNELIDTLDIKESDREKLKKIKEISNRLSENL